jgi:hypothetical protein
MACAVMADADVRLRRMAMFCSRLTNNDRWQEKEQQRRLSNTLTRCPLFQAESACMSCWLWCTLYVTQTRDGQGGKSNGDEDEDED